MDEKKEEIADDYYLEIKGVPGETEMADDADDRPNFNDLKIEINEIVWRNAADDTTLEKADEIACAFWKAICETHIKN